jgi:cytochrome c peroxidase
MIRLITVSVATALLAAPVLMAQVPPQTAPIPPALSTVSIRYPDNIDSFIRDPQWAVALGKAFFWDMQAGSDGVTACATCHFHAGADARNKNQLNPGQANTAGSPLTETFDPTFSGPGGPNTLLSLADFPFHRTVDPTDANSDVLFSSDDVMGSQGVFAADFNAAMPGSPVDDCDCASDLFNVGGVGVRRTTARNTPSAINAIFNSRNFWDGRANLHFNGVDPFGKRNTGATVWVRGPGGVTSTSVDLSPASLASQAVGPPLSGTEMSCGGRDFPDLGRSLLALRPLGLQRVDATDNVLGPLARKGKPGLRISYARMIHKAFWAPWWRGGGFKTPDGYSMQEANFSLYWGLAILMYEATLVADDTPFDQFRNGNFAALTQQEQDGMLLFYDKTVRCSDCHRGPEFTGAALRILFPEVPSSPVPNQAFIENMIVGDGGQSLYDSGFYNIGVRQTSEDIGIGAVGPFGNPLSFTRQVLGENDGLLLAADPEAAAVDPCFLVSSPCKPFPFGMRDSADGAFKTPGLRNVELTGPYFHNGGTATLRQVVEFYNRGGDARTVGLEGTDFHDTTGFADNPSNKDEIVKPLGLSDAEMDALVAFMEALTDERVRWEAAPFDHPQLFLSTGALGDELLVPPAAVLCNEVLKSLDDFRELPAVGAGGRGVLGLPPVSKFEDGLK